MSVVTSLPSNLSWRWLKSKSLRNLVEVPAHEILNKIHEQHSLQDILYLEVLGDVLALFVLALVVLALEHVVVVVVCKVPNGRDDEGKRVPENVDDEHSYEPNSVLGRVSVEPHAAHDRLWEST